MNFLQLTHISGNTYFLVNQDALSFISETITPEVHYTRITLKGREQPLEVQESLAEIQDMLYLDTRQIWPNED